jgi:hypothetical protein
MAKATRAQRASKKAARKAANRKTSTRNLTEDAPTTAHSVTITDRASIRGTFGDAMWHATAKPQPRLPGTNGGALEMLVPGYGRYTGTWEDIGDWVVAEQVGGWIRYINVLASEVEFVVSLNSEVLPTPA